VYHIASSLQTCHFEQESDEQAAAKLLSSLISLRNPWAFPTNLMPRTTKARADKWYSELRSLVIFYILDQLLYPFTQENGRQGSAIQILGPDKLHEAFEGAHESRDERVVCRAVIL